jgi:hypothetical protein
MARADARSADEDTRLAYERDARSIGERHLWQAFREGVRSSAIATDDDTGRSSNLQGPAVSCE